MVDNMKFQIIFLSILTVSIGCNSISSSKLVGDWQAYYISEGGVPLEIDFSEVGFTFTEDGLYTFKSTINYKEAGTYYVNGKLLFTMDTVNTASIEKAVQIEEVSVDSLILKMKANGEDKIMKLKKYAR